MAPHNFADSLRLRKTLPRVAKRSPRSSIIGAGSPIDAPRAAGAQIFALLQALAGSELSSWGSMWVATSTVSPPSSTSAWRMVPWERAPASPPTRLGSGELVAWLDQLYKLGLD